MATTDTETPRPAPKIVAGVFALPPQMTRDSRGKMRFNNLFVRLVKGTGTINDKNWSLDDEAGVPIVAEYISGKLPLPANTAAAIWSETGQEGGKTMISAPTYVTVGKNLGRSNETTALTQAISEAWTRWDKNARKGGAVSSTADLSVVQNGRPKPMALEKFPPQPIDGKFDISDTPYWKEGQPIFISPKVDGNRMVARVANATVDLWGRAGDTPPNPLTNIRHQLAAMGEAATFDGEVYAPNVKHQLINGTYMNEGADADFLEYWVFDLIMPGTFTERYKRLTEIMAARASARPNIKLVPATIVSTSAEIERIYRGYLAAGYEGAVLRKPDGKYESGMRKEMRSKSVLKLKPEYDAEYEIVGYKDGEGGASGAIIWVLKMPDSDKTFTATPRQPVEERRALFAAMPARFEADYKGKMMRVFYGDTTINGIPRFPRADEIRTVA